MDDVARRLLHYQQKPLIASILSKLRVELSSDLYYHDYRHTDDVMQEALLFATTDGISEREEELVMVAAAYHDAGFLKSYVDNEQIGAQMARDAMVADGSFTDDEVKLVERMIQDTRLVFTTSGVRQISTVELSKYLLDADLGNLGRDDFFDRGELYRRELGYDREPFLKFTFELLNAHRWQSNAARQLRQAKKAENILLLKDLLNQVSLQATQGIEGLDMSIDRLGFLAKLPLLLNSSLDMRRILSVALEQLKVKLNVEAVTVFLLDDSTEFLTFWALQGARAAKLEGMKMPSKKGIVGWVIEHQEPVLVDDVTKDPRFFSNIDREGDFVTKNLMCVPLTVRGDCKLGAVQVLNKQSDAAFVADDLHFLEQFAHQVALAVDNARLYEALEERSKKLEKLDQRKNEMITVIAHEFRTPLNLIGTSADLLSSGLDNQETVRKMSEVLANGVQRLTKLIAEIKNLSLVSNDRVDVNPSKFEVTGLIRDLLEQFEPVSKKRSLKFKNACEKGPIEVVGDSALILVVLRNLISNAIRFTPDKGTVTVKTSRAAGLIRISITDTGIGIDQGEFSTIFEKFYEVGDVLQHSSGEHEFKSGGLGLGLATVKAILEAHGSAIELDSVPGKGSTFSFRLPEAEV